MANFKAPIATLFNGEQFELVNGNVINAKAIFNIEIGYDATENKYACNHNLAEIAEAVGKGADINVKFTGADGKVSYDQWGIDEIDAAKVVFKNGYYRNDEDYERCWIEESIELLAAYFKDAKTLELVEKVVYSRDYKIKYIANLPAGKTLVGKVPAPKFASEVDEDGEYIGNFAFIAEDFVAPTCTVDGLEFGGWFKDAACSTQYEVGDAITKDIKLYAKWAAAAEPSTLSVTFKNTTPDEVFGPIVNTDYKVGDTLDLNKAGSGGTFDSADVQKFFNQAADEGLFDITEAVIIGISATAGITKVGNVGTIDANVSSLEIVMSVSG